MISRDFTIKQSMYVVLFKLSLKETADGAIYYSPGVYTGFYIGGGLT